LVVALAIPAVSAAQPAPSPATGTPPAAAKAPEQWKGEVIAVDPAEGRACVRLEDGQMIELGGGGGETLRQFKIGMKVSGTLQPAAPGGRGQSVSPRKAKTCPFPLPLTMTYDAWKKDTSVFLSTRDKELLAVDDALQRYWAASDDNQRAFRRSAVERAFDAWAAAETKRAKEGDWRKSPRNNNHVAEKLDADLKAKEVKGATADDAAGWAYMEQKNKERLADLFTTDPTRKGQKAKLRLQLRKDTALGALIAANDRFKEAFKKHEKELANDVPVPDKSSTAGESLILALLGEAKDTLKDQVMGHVKDEAFLRLFNHERGPWGELVMGWKDVAKDLWTKRQVAKAKGAIAPGDPTKAFEAMVKKLDDDIKTDAIKAGIKTLFGLGKVASGPAGLPAGAVALEVADHFVAVIFELVELAGDAAEAKKANDLLDAGTLDAATLFDASTLLAAYYLADSDTSAVIFLAKPFGVTTFVYQTDEIRLKAQPVIDKAGELIGDAKYEIPELRYMKGGRSKAKVTDKVKKAAQDAAGVKRDPQEPQAPTITPQNASNALFAQRWPQWTKVTVRRSDDVKALDDALDEAVQAWGKGDGDRNILRDDLRMALFTWQKKKGKWETSERNAQGAIVELEKRIGTLGAGTCPRIPADCNGPWEDTPRTDLKDCAPRPVGCDQVVLGRLKDLKPYRGCPGYITLNLSDEKYSADVNDRFIACAAAGRLRATCNPPIRVVSKGLDIPDYSVTFHELSQLRECGCLMQVNYGTGGFVQSCPTGLPSPVPCPLLRGSCKGPWQSQPRPASYGECAARPRKDCQQVVLGVHDDLKKYIGCDGYIALDLSAADWTEERADQFLACAAANQLAEKNKNCEPPILIASEWDKIMAQPTIFRQIAQLGRCKCTMAVQERGLGQVERCPAGVSASVPGLPRAWARRACDGPPSAWELLMELLRPLGRGIVPAAARAAR
jgi:hypothetical protein